MHNQSGLLIFSAYAEDMTLKLILILVLLLLLASTEWIQHRGRGE